MATPPIVTWAAWAYPEWLAAGGAVPRWPALVRRVLPFWVLLAAYGALRHLAMGGIAPVPVQLAGLPAQVLRALVATATYGEMTLVPQPTRGMYTVDPPAGLSDGRVLLGFVIVALLLVGLIGLPRRNPAAGLALGWYALALVPASNLLPIYYSDVIQVAERSLYPALVGWCLFLAVGAHALWRVWRPGLGRAAALTRVVGAIVVGTFLLVTAVKVGAWRDDVTLWKSSLDSHPGSFLTRLSLGWALARAGDLRGAQSVVQEASERFPTDSRMAFLAGWIAEAQGQPAEALRHYEEAVARGIRLEAAYRQLALLTARQGLWERAGHWFAVGAELYPESAWPQVGLGWYRERQGQAELARAHFDRAGRLAPNSPERPWLLSQLLAYEGRRDEAVQAFQVALALDPSFVPARRALALIAEQEGRPADAIDHWRHISAAAPPGGQRREAAAHLRQLETAASGPAPARTR